MATLDRRTPYGLSVGAACALAVWVAASGQEAKPRLEVCRHPGADGKAAQAVDLRQIEAWHRELLRGTQKALKSFVGRAQGMKDRGHHALVRSCSAQGMREIRLEETVPPRFRGLTAYFVRAPRGGARESPILSASLPDQAQVFVVEAESLADVAALSKRLGRRVSLATKEFAQALGVTCTDARVTFSEDGRRSTVWEVAP
jgi:hypothetical protein